MENNTKNYSIHESIVQGKRILRAVQGDACEEVLVTLRDLRTIVRSLRSRGFSRSFWSPAVYAQGGA